MWQLRGTVASVGPRGEMPEQLRLPAAGSRAARADSVVTAEQCARVASLRPTEPVCEVNGGTRASSDHTNSAVAARIDMFYVSCSDAEPPVGIGSQ